MVLDVTQKATRVSVAKLELVKNDKTFQHYEEKRRRFISTLAAIAE